MSDYLDFPDTDSTNGQAQTVLPAGGSVGIKQPLNELKKKYKPAVSITGQQPSVTGEAQKPPETKESVSPAETAEKPAVKKTDRPSFFSEVPKQQEGSESDSSGFWNSLNAQMENQQSEQDSNADRYSIRLRPEQYDVLNQYISSTDDPKEAEQRAYRMATAMRYSQYLGVPLKEAAENLDNYNLAFFGDDANKRDDKGNWRAVTDSFWTGVNTLKQGDIGNKIMEAELRGHTELADSLKQQYALLDQDNETMRDDLPRSWGIEALKFGAQSAPFTGASIAAGLLPGVGALAAFGVSYFNTQGLEYMEMRADGATPETAAKVSALSGAAQAAVEVGLGDTAAFTGGILRAAGREIIGEKARTLLINKLADSVFKRLHYSGAFKAVAHTLMRYAGENIEEGAEEAVQEAISLMGKSLAASMDDYQIEHKSAGEIAQDLAEQFKGGFLGSIVLGVPMTGVNLSTNIRDYTAVKYAAEHINSGDAFKQAVKDSPVFASMDEKDKSALIDTVWQNAGKKRTENADKEAQSVAEIYAQEEGMEEAGTDSEGNTVNTPAYRTESGRLYEQNDVGSELDNGQVHGTFKVGDGTKEKDNIYGYIKYTLDEDNSKVTIDKFVTTEARGNLKEEIYSDFAEDFAGYDIVWDTKENRAAALKEQLSALNPRGKSAGLNYFASAADIADERTRIDVSNQIKQAMPNLSAKERSAAVALLEAGAKAQKQTITDYVSNTFGENIFGAAQTAVNAAQAQGKSIRGGVSFDDTVKGVRAVIYASEKSDFSTWTHEIAHVWRRQLTGDLKTQAEQAFGVTDSNWTTEQEEKFAVGFEDYLRTGRARSARLQDLYKNLAEFVSRIYGALKERISFNRQITDVYDQLMAGDDSVLAAAEKAVSAADVRQSSTGKGVAGAENISENAENVDAQKNSASGRKVGQNGKSETAAAGKGGISGEETSEAARSGSSSSTGTAAASSASDAGRTAETIIANPDASAEEKTQAALNAAGEKLQGGEPVDLFQTSENVRPGTIFFQTEEELMKDAASFDTWQDFKEAYETDWLRPSDAAVPSDADAAWYQNFFEHAKGIVSEQDKQNREAETQSERDEAAGDRPEVKDSLFYAEIGQKGKLEEFLTRVQHILNDKPSEHHADAEEAAENDKLLREQRFIRTQLAHGTWLANAMRVSQGNKLTESTRSRMLSLISRAERDYRAVYAEVMDKPEWSVAESDSISAKLARNNLVGTGENIEELSPEKRRQLAERVNNMEIKRKLKDGTLKIDSDLQAYVDDLDKQVGESGKKLDELKAETAEDYRKLSDWEQRRLLDVYDELQRAKLHYPLKSDQTARHLEKGLKIAGQYATKDQSHVRADYNTIYRQYMDLYNTTKISEELKAAIKRREQLADITETNRTKKEERAALEQVKDLRKQLVKRAMRRVSFDRVDYDSARTLIAIQRVFEPNLFGGVNKWIGTEGIWPRAVWSEYHTDERARERITNLLQRSTSGSKLVKLLEDTQTEEQFNAWSKKDRATLYRVMPEENWIRDLHLEDLAEEREGSIQMDIGTDTQTRTVTGKNGKKRDEVYTTAKYSDEIGKLIRDAVGPDMYENIIHRPFAEWTTSEMEDFAKKIDDIYVNGRNMLAARRQVEKEQAADIRKKIEAAVKNTGIQINDDDPEDVKQKKLEKINKKLGYTSEIKGTAADKYKRQSFISRMSHWYGDANMRRVARLLDNYSEGTNTNMLYWRQEGCYQEQERNKERRQKRIDDAMKEYDITLPELYKQTTYKNFKGKERDAHISVDELLFYLKASEDLNSRDACAYGCMLDEEDRAAYRKMDEESAAGETERKKKLNEALQKGDTAAAGQYRQVSADMVDENGVIVPPGTAAYKERCDAMFEQLLNDARALPDKFHKFADAISADYAEEFDRINRVSIEEFNTPVWRVEKYVPLYRLSSMGDTNENRVRADMLANTAAAEYNPGASHGFTNKRVNISPLNQRGVESGLYKTWVDSVNTTEHYIAYAKYVRELNRIYLGTTAAPTRQLIESRYGTGMRTYIENYIHEVANPDAGTVMSELDQLCRTLRGKTAPAYLAWKISSIMKQAVTSPAPFFQFVTPAEYASAALKMVTTKGALGDAIREKSVFMKNRTMDPMIDLINEQAEKASNKVSWALGKFQQTGMQGLEWIDWASVAPGWYAVYSKEHTRLESEQTAKREQIVSQLAAENDGKSYDERMNEQQISAEADRQCMDETDIEQAAVNKADDCTRLCQPSGRSVDLAPLFKTKNEVARAALQFQTALNVIWQQIKYDIPYAVHNKQGMQVVRMLAGYAAAGIALGVLADGLPDKDDDDKKKQERMRKFLYSSTTQFSDSVPMIGSIVSALDEKLITGKGGWQSGTDLFPTVTKFTQGASSVSKGDWDKTAERFAEGLGLTLGLPVSGTKEAAEFLGVGDGDGKAEVNPGALLGRR